MRPPRIRSGDGSHTLVLSDGSEIHAPAVVVATGVSYRRLGIARLERLVGAGVFYVSVSSEAFAMAGEDVFVAGAGNSAAQAALHLAKYARRVTMVTRRDRPGRDHVGLSGHHDRGCPPPSRS